MADFEEWLEGTADVDMADGGVSQFNPNEALGEQPWERDESETVVCLVDCSEAMFERFSPPPLVPSSEQGRTSSTAVTPQCAFAMTLQSVRRLLQEIIVSTNRDAVSVVLYNTRELNNDMGLHGIYVVPESGQVGSACLERVVQLEAAGVPDSPAYDAFMETIGCAPTSKVGSNQDDTCGLTCKLSDALSVAQDVLLRSCDEGGTTYRRLLVFTNDSDPTHGFTSEWEKCCRLARTLASTGVALEVFGFERGITRDGPGAATSLDSTVAETPHVPSAVMASPTTSTSCTVAFKSAFWEKLLEATHAPSVQPTATEWSYGAAAARPGLYGYGEGSMHVYAGVGMLGQLLRTVVRRAHRQLPLRHFELRIGRATQLSDGVEGSALPSAAAAAAAIPRMTVSLYTPLIRAKPPRSEYVDTHTRQIARRVVRLYASREAGNGGNAEEGDGEGIPSAAVEPRQVRGRDEVNAEDVCCYARVREERVYFTKEERRKLVEVATGDAELGFTVLLFKDVRDAVRRAHVVQRASFIHARVEGSGPQSHRLFVLLVRRLRAKGKAAIAQYRSTSTSAPRLVALVPSPDLGSNSASCAQHYQLPAKGLGLYVVPLPFAEDLRRIPRLGSCGVVHRSEAPCPADCTVDPAHRVLAHKVVTALTVPYVIDKVPNPTLQRQYAALQRLARFRHPPGDDRLAVDNTHVGCGGELGGADAVSLLMDGSLPDDATMHAYAPLFDAFNATVLGREYNPAAYCPQAAAQSRAMRRPRATNSDGGDTPASTEGAVRDAAARNAWTSLTVKTLKEYLSLVGVSVGPAQHKTDLIELAKEHMPCASSST
jgi:ATP-dependent DNA helicase 2 subunit 1